MENYAAETHRCADKAVLSTFFFLLVSAGSLAENTRIDASRLYHSQIEAFFSASSASCGVLLFIRKQIRDQAIQWRWATILPISSQMRHNHPYPDLSYNSLQPFPPSFTTNHIFCHDIGLQYVQPTTMIKIRLNWIQYSVLSLGRLCSCSLRGVGRSINLFAYIVLVDFPWTLAVSQTAASRSAHLSLPYDILVNSTASSGIIDVIPPKILNQHNLAHLAYCFIRTLATRATISMLAW
jgi:hypothetical protein